MEWMKDFFIPLGSAIIIIAFLGGLLFVFGKWFYFFYRKQLRFFLKYKLFRNKYPDEIMEYCVENLEDNKGINEVKMQLLKDGNKWDNVHEIMYIYKNIQKQYQKEVLK